MAVSKTGCAGFSKRGGSASTKQISQQAQLPGSLLNAKIKHGSTWESSAFTTTLAELALRTAFVLVIGTVWGEIKSDM